MTEGKLLLTMLEARTQLRISQQTLNNIIKRGEIVIVRLSPTRRYIRQEDLDKFIKEHTGIYKQ